jgi:hypothetical protein
MREKIILNEASEKLKEYKDLTVEAEFTNDFQKLQSLELKYLYLFFHPFSFFGNEQYHVYPRFFLFSVWHVLIVVADNYDCCCIKHTINKL